MRTLCTLFMVAILATGLASQSKTLVPDLRDVASGKDWKVVGRSVTLENENGTDVLRFDAQQGQGLAYLPGLRLDNGTIEFDVRGKNVFQRSFVGIAFHGVDENTFDAIYFRPFNFKSEDSTRRAHAVQYISSPDYGWPVLRGKYPGKYEQPVQSAPDPDGWFHARVVLDYPTVSVFVDNADQPCLVVRQLNDIKTGWVGLFVGEGSDGGFANLKITSNK